MPLQKEPRGVGSMLKIGDVGESSNFNPVEHVVEDTFLRDLIPPRSVPTRRNNVQTPVEEGEVMFEGGADPMEVDDYMDQVETQLTSMNVTNDYVKIIIATYKFSKDAKLWWKLITNQIEGYHNRFKELFYEKYFPAPKRWELRDQFNGFIQSNMSVTEYENKFTSFSHFALEMVNNEVEKTRKFVSGLDYKIRPLITAQYIKVYSEAVERSLMLEAEAKNKDARKEQ
ncbi:uncharacterized protein LOC132288784 [Cornus florida]|uniref:uncharacterized protein LOC132288784 n=1 Tax=Cornus florida TaxID=4283 RepID=UPI00289EB628|nr:uncharacterized protein LOC132288784 [Cornus florida]